MADQRRIFRVGSPLVEQGLKPAGGASEEKGFQSSGHTIFYTKTENLTTEAENL